MTLDGYVTFLTSKGCLLRNLSKVFGHERNYDCEKCSNCDMKYNTRNSNLFYTRKYCTHASFLQPDIMNCNNDHDMMQPQTSTQNEFDIEQVSTILDNITQPNILQSKDNNNNFAVRCGISELSKNTDGPEKAMIESSLKKDANLSSKRHISNALKFDKIEKNNTTKKPRQNAMSQIIKTTQEPQFHTLQQKHKQMGKSKSQAIEKKLQIRNPYAKSSEYNSISKTCNMIQQSSQSTLTKLRATEMIKKQARENILKLCRRCFCSKGTYCNGVDCVVTKTSCFHCNGQHRSNECQLISRIKCIKCHNIFTPENAFLSHGRMCNGNKQYTSPPDHKELVKFMSDKQRGCIKCFNPDCAHNVPCLVKRRIRGALMNDAKKHNETLLQSIKRNYASTETRELFLSSITFH